MTRASQYSHSYTILGKGDVMSVTRDEAPFTGLEPRALWQHFAAFTRIGRPSGREEAITQYVARWAADHNFASARDATGNLYVYVPGTSGRDGAPTVVLQGHLDMVCERASDSPNDAEHGRIRVVQEGEWLRGEGTTLGADNGVGLAAMLAVAESAVVAHGPLELLLTVDEETGLTGAANVDPSMLRGRLMLNLDSEEEGKLYVGCAGGSDTESVWSGTLDPVAEGWTALAVSVGGLQGGHSGIDIDKNRLNAIHALTRLLLEALTTAAIRVSSFAGGNRPNAIPREAAAVILTPTDAASACEGSIGRAAVALRREYAARDAGFSVTVTALDRPPSRAFGPENSQRLLHWLRAMPSGVVAMSTDLPGLVETSVNLGVVRTVAERIEVTACARSSVAAALRGLIGSIRSVATLAGATTEERDGYPGWTPDLSSRSLAAASTAFHRLYGQNPDVTAVHAGLECGLIGERVPGLDMVSFGPTILGAHAPGERVNTASVERFWNLLIAVLDDLSR